MLRTREYFIRSRRSALERINQRLDAILARLKRANAALDRVSAKRSRGAGRLPLLTPGPLSH